MRLEPIFRAVETPFSFVCYKCEKSFRTDTNPGCCADLEGLPFRSFYCGECASDIALGSESAAKEDPTSDPAAALRGKEKPNRELAAARREALAAWNEMVREWREQEHYGPAMAHWLELALVAGIEGAVGPASISVGA